MQGGNYFNKVKVEKIRDNIRCYEWAKNLTEDTVKKAEHLIAFGKHFWWTLPTPNELARSSNACQLNNGCPHCGKELLVKYGTTGWVPKIEDNQWKVECPNCQSIFPSNDFKSYYESGLDERGVFKRENADSSYLINTLYPDKGDNYFVDDGTGCKDEFGVFWTFIPYYIHHGLWLDVHNIGSVEKGLISNGVKYFAEAWIYTGELKYALYCLMVLYKVAMVYPDMDLNVWMRIPGRPYRNSDGFSLQGKVVGSIWETFTARLFCYAADAVLPVLSEYPDLVEEFMSDIYGTDVKAINNVIIDGIVREVYSGVKDASICGNEGMHQSALAMAAVCMGECSESKKWLEFLFAPGARIMEKDSVRTIKTTRTGCNVFGVLENKVNGNGLGDECSPMYNRLWMVELARLADILSAYPGITGSKYDIKTHPVMKKMYRSYVPLNLDNDFIPKTGDTGKTGNPMKIFDGDNLQKFLMDGYTVTKDKGILDLFNMSYPDAREGKFGFLDVENPEDTAALLKTAKDPKEPINTRSDNLTDYGNALLRQKERYGCNIHMYYGRTTGHGHLDKMNFEIIANGINCTPDLGYPEYAENFPERHEWTAHTVSHNTVMVDESAQNKTLYAGTPYGFEDDDVIRYIDVDDPSVYNQVSMYRRSLCMVEIEPGNAYFVDFFRVVGGNAHQLIFHGGEGDVSVKGTELIKQSGGTLQGEDVPFGEWKDRKRDDRGNGFHFLYDVAKSDEKCEYIELEYKLKDTWNTRTDKTGQPYIKAYILGDKCQNVIAKGQPPTNKIGNPKFLYYYLGKRQGNDLKSRFVSVYEPYVDNESVSSVELININGIKDDFVSGCVKITLNDGTVDYVINSIDENIKLNIENDIIFKGRLGFLRIKNQKVVKAFISAGSELIYKQNEIFTNKTPAVKGHVASYQKEISNDNYIDIKPEQGLVSYKNLIGRFINIEGTGVGNASYKILDVLSTDQPCVIRLITGETAVRGYKDMNDPKSGYVYRFSEGAKFEIPLCETFC